MTEERRDSSIFVLGILIAAALALYGLWIEGNPTVVEIVELVTNHVVEFLEPKIITRVDKQVIYMTATPGPSVDSIIYGTPIPQLAALDSADVVATLRALTPVAPTEVPAPTEVAQQAPTIAPAPTEVVEQMPTAAPAPPEVAQQAPTAALDPPTTLPTIAQPVVPTDAPVLPTVAPTNTPVPPSVVPTDAPVLPTVAPTNTPVPPPVVPTDAPVLPTVAPTNTPVPPPVVRTNTQVPPTLAPTNTPVPPTLAPTNTPVPPTLAPTNTPVPTTVPPTVVPPTNTPTPPPTLKPLTPVVQALAPPELVEENPEQIAASNGMATLQGHIDFIDESSLTLILTNGDYYNGFEVASDGEFWFENVPNGTYNLSIAGKSGCGQIEISVPEGHATLTYNYRFYKMQCTPD